MVATPRAIDLSDLQLAPESLRDPPAPASGARGGYEEYHPFGTTSWHAAPSATTARTKRYKFTAKEKDEYTGLYYIGARYYACWLGRWISADPAGMVDGPNRYAYVRNNPVRFHDTTGRYAGEALTSQGKFVERLGMLESAIETQQDVDSPGGTLAVINRDITAKRAEQVIQNVPGVGGGFSYKNDLGQFVNVGGVPLDVKHFFKYSEFAHQANLLGGDSGEVAAAIASTWEEDYQALDPRPAAATSAWSPEDAVSNTLGGIFGAKVDPSQPLASQVGTLLQEAEVFFTTGSEPDGGEFIGELESHKLMKAVELYGGSVEDVRVGSNAYTPKAHQERMAGLRAALDDSPTYKLFIQQVYSRSKGDTPRESLGAALEAWSPGTLDRASSLFRRMGEQRHPSRHPF